MASSTGSRPHDSEPPRDGGALEAAHYLQGAIAELSQMAHRHRHGMLAYLLDMALMEANEIVRPGGRPGHSGR
jgi:hypothetical protein